MVIEKSTRLGDYIKTERILDANISSALLRNIFHKNAPLHDGAVIIRDFKIYAAGCFLPMPSHDETVGALGSRHRAGVGVSEFSDSLVIIVSEETGSISVAFGGELYRNFNAESLESLIRSFFNERSIEKHFSKRKQNEKKTDEDTVAASLKRVKNQVNDDSETTEPVRK